MACVHVQQRSIKCKVGKFVVYASSKQEAQSFREAAKASGLNFSIEKPKRKKVNPSHKPGSVLSMTLY